MHTQRFFFALARIALGWTFLWAFLDKTFGFGLSTEKGSSWLAGGSPTTGFLTNAVQGPFAEFFSSLAGTPWVDWVFMLGLLLIGVALMLGIALRLAGFFGGIMMLLIYAAASIPLQANPFVDSHIVYALTLFGFSVSDLGEPLGFGKQWRRTGFVKKFPLLK